MISLKLFEWCLAVFLFSVSVVIALQREITVPGGYANSLMEISGAGVLGVAGLPLFWSVAMAIQLSWPSGQFKKLGSAFFALGLISFSSSYFFVV